MSAPVQVAKTANCKFTVKRLTLLVQGIRRLCLVTITGLLTACANPTVLPTLALDVGHSKQHPGAISARGKTEFEFNAALAKVIHNELSAQAFHTVLIGATGDKVVLSERTAEAQQAGATFFLSIHHDSVQPHYLKPWQWQGVTQQYTDDFSGFSLFVSRQNPQLATSLHCASAIGAALKQKGLHPSTHHAEAINGENKAQADQANGVYYYDNLVVLKTATTPAVLLEAGVIVNRNEEQRIQTPALQTTIAKAITTGLIACGQLKPMTKSSPF